MCCVGQRQIDQPTGYSNPRLEMPVGDSFSVLSDDLQQTQRDINLSRGSRDLMHNGSHFQVRMATGNRFGFLRCRKETTETIVATIMAGARTTTSVTEPAKERARTMPGKKKNMKIK